MEHGKEFIEQAQKHIKHFLDQMCNDYVLVLQEGVEGVNAKN